jgi:uncharacterized protein (TIGR03086 family)
MTSPVTGGDLLGQAIGYALRSVAAVTPMLLTRPTPCADWDLLMLLRHSCESLSALGEGMDLGRVHQAAADNDAPGTDPAELFTARASGLLDRWSRFSWPWVCVGEQRLAVTDFAAAGALEVAVHGWDVGRACGQRRPVPAPLAERLLAVAPLLVTDADRASPPGQGASSAPLFGPPVAIRPTASASDRLTAFLGRTWSCEQPE